MEAKDIKSQCTLEEIAMDIISMDGSMEHWAEVVVNAGGSLVNLEIIVTYVNGLPYGKKYVSDKSLPKWKLLIKRLLKI